MKLIAVLPYCQKDHTSATRLLNWIKELDGHVDHALLLVADDAVPMDTKKALDALGKTVFAHSETILVKAPAPVGDNYHAPAAMMFLRAMGHIEQCYRWPFLWMEPDCVPLKHGWLDALAQEYENSPKEFMGSMMRTSQEGVPSQIFFATAIYPRDSHHRLKEFCDGKQAFDMAFSPYVVPRGTNTPLMFHCFGSPNDPPTFKDVKMPGDGPNVGTLESIPKQAVFMHRCKDGTLIDLLQKRNSCTLPPSELTMSSLQEVACSLPTWTGVASTEPAPPPIPASA